MEPSFLELHDGGGDFVDEFVNILDFAHDFGIGTVRKQFLDYIQQVVEVFALQIVVFNQRSDSFQELNHILEHFGLVFDIFALFLDLVHLLLLDFTDQDLFKRVESDFEIGVIKLLLLEN